MLADIVNVKMTEKEIRIIAEIMTTADGGCSNCAGDMMHELIRQFPQFDRAIREVYFTAFEYEMD